MHYESIAPDMVNIKEEEEAAKQRKEQMQKQVDALNRVKQCIET